MPQPAGVGATPRAGCIGSSPCMGYSSVQHKIRVIEANEPAKSVLRLDASGICRLASRRSGTAVRCGGRHSAD
jgi:hypothetical protein